MYKQALNSTLSTLKKPIRRNKKWGIVFGTEKSTISSTSIDLSSTLSFKKIQLKQSPLEIFVKLYKQYPNAYLLESIEGPKKLAQYSFLGFDPNVTIKIKNGISILHDEQSGQDTQAATTNPLQIIKQALRGRSTANKDFRFVGGAVGYISYDAIRYWEKIPSKARDELNFPDVEMGIYDDGLVFDHKQKRIYYYYYNKNRLSEIAQLLKKNFDSEPLVVSQPQVNIAKEQYEEAVEKAKKYVTQGDIFQAVLSKRFDIQFKGDLTEFYCALRRINPSPYMYFYKAENRQIVGSSPEMLARVENGTLETFPIAGTRQVSANIVENRKLARQLLADPKERAEHIMLVDLARNDVGKVSKFGSVRVPQFMQVHRYSHVQHIVSRVVGDLKAGYDSYDSLQAVFPAGTVSGAPKIRAMEIIEELEPSRRGPYAGAVGYFSYNGNMDFAITIRTLFANKDNAYIQAGAGIVADSVPEHEWFETEHKAGALLKALQTSEGKSK